MSDSAATLQAAHTSLLDRSRDGVSLPLVSQLRAIAEQSGTPPNAVASAFAALMFGPGRLAFPDFVKLRLYDTSLPQGASLKTFVGQRRNRDLCVAVNFRHDWLGLMTNKVASSQYLAAYGLPTIPATAVYRPWIETAKASVLSSQDELAAFLLRPDVYPLFGKPVESFQSLGSIGLTGVDPGRRELVRFDGRVVRLDALMSEVGAYEAGGYLFQPMLAPHLAIAALCGNRLATARIVTILTGDGPRIFRACWKIPAGRNTADNYWRAGNLLAQVDPRSGCILRVTSGTGLSTIRHTEHPDTGAPLIGVRHPEWDAVKRLAMDGARVMRHVPLIGWDLAATAGGLVIVEMNETPDFFLPQFADRRGVLDAEFVAFAAEQKKHAAAFTRSCKAAVARL